MTISVGTQLLERKSEQSVKKTKCCELRERSLSVLSLSLMDPERILPVQVPVEVTLPRATTTASLYRYSWHGLADVMVALYFVILSDGVVGVPVGVCHWSGAVAS